MSVENFDKVCRTCMQKDSLVPIFLHSNIQSILETCMSLEINAADNLPKHICQRCYVKLDDFFTFRKQIIYHNEIFRQILRKDKFLNEFNYSNNKNNGSLECNQYDDRKENINEEKCFKESKEAIKKDSEKEYLKINEAENVNEAILDRTNLNKTHKKKDFNGNFLCEICGKLLSSNFTLAQHLQVHSGHKPFACDRCDKKFFRTEHLKQHERTHTGEKPHKCKICLKTFAQISALTAHKRTHSGEKPHVCNICAKAFAQSISLTYHIRTHTGEVPYKCELCGKGFANSGNLNIHKRFHNNERPFKCEQCPKSFVTVSHLKVHINQHNGIKSHKCDVCQKAFVRSTHLKEHMVTHSGDRPYCCNFCSKRYSQSGHLKRHMKKSHDIQDKQS